MCAADERLRILPSVVVSAGRGATRFVVVGKINYCLYNGGVRSVYKMYIYIYVEYAAEQVPHRRVGAADLIIPVARCIYTRIYIHIRYVIYFQRYIQRDVTQIFYEYYLYTRT